MPTLQFIQCCLIATFARIAVCALNARLIITCTQAVQEGWSVSCAVSIVSPVLVLLQIAHPVILSHITVSLWEIRVLEATITLA